MATSNKKPTSVTRSADLKTITYEWDAFENGDDGAPIRLDGYTRPVVQIEVVDQGVGGSISIEGSVNPEPAVDGDWVAEVTVTDTDALSKIAEVPLFLRPHCTAGDGSTDYNVFITIQRLDEKRL